MQKVFSKTQISLLILYILPVALLLWFVANFSVNVPYWDQWRLTPLFEKVATGNASFADFFTVHGHHRILIPKLIITALAFASKWNTQYEIICSVFFVIITFLAIYKIASTQLQNEDKNFMHIANILTCLLLFSLVQHQNWLWGFTIFWFLTNLCLIMAIFFIHTSKNLSSKTKMLMAGASCFIGSFTLAQGLFSWPVLIPSILSIEGKPKEKKWRVIIWISLFILLCFIYAINYNPIREPKPFLLTEQPLLIINYFLAVLGLPLVRVPILSILTGLILFSAFLFFSFYFIKKPFTKLTFVPETIPWLTIGAFSLISALSISVGRAEYGIENAIISSRYTTTSILLIISHVHLLGLFLKHQQKYLPVYKIFAVVMTGIIIINSIYVVTWIKFSFPYMESRKECLEIINYLEDSEFIRESRDSCLVLMNGKTWLVRKGAKIMERLGWREFPQNLEFLGEPQQNYGYLDNLQTTEELIDTNINETITLGGWAIMPDRKKQPHLVLLSSGQNKSFFANGIVNLESNDITKTLDSKQYSRARWNVAFSAKSLPVGKTVINAWIYNSEQQQFIKLNNQVKVRITDN